MTISVGRCMEGKVVKELINKNFATSKSLRNLHELHTNFKETHPNVNIGFWKFCALRPKWCVLAGSKMTHVVCACCAHQNFVLLVDVMVWDLTYKDPIKITFSCLTYFHQNLFGITFLSTSSQEYFFTGTSLVHLIWKWS